MPIYITYNGCTDTSGSSSKYKSFIAKYNKDGTFASKTEIYTRSTGLITLAKIPNNKLWVIIEYGICLQLNEVHNKDVNDDDYAADKALEDIEEPISKTGDIWLLGKHRLICGDSTKLLDVEKSMDRKKANLCVIDPPYNVNYSAGKENERVIKNDTWRF
ncbi:hypothetical protein BS101_14520 [Clostridium kluyveri]|uniref:DNA methylase N-4/N-6 domain-containing protein n=2 Tax=Clostridium kluyveri TaxID=1534 RepID=A0A1L5FA13_CLOKL|nr:hypothetical protein BS101_14520 [Clostridium kluyveri]